jgi:chromosome segregation ATPase
MSERPTVDDGWSDGGELRKLASQGLFNRHDAEKRQALRFGAHRAIDARDARIRELEARIRALEVELDRRSVTAREMYDAAAELRAALRDRDDLLREKDGRIRELEAWYLAAGSEVGHERLITEEMERERDEARAEAERLTRERDEATERQREVE